MNLRIHPSLFLLLIITACHTRSKHVPEPGAEPGADSTAQADTAQAAAAVSQVDTNYVVSLKRAGNLAVEDVICQRWTFDNADGQHWKQIFWDKAEDVRQFPELALYPDHQALRNARMIPKIGTWVLNKDTRELQLHYENGEAEKLKIEQMVLKQMQVAEDMGGESPASIRLSAEALVDKKPQEDPYYPGNNRWRIRPAVAETKEQIRQRVRGCVHFYSLFFLDNYRRGETEINYDGLPCCFEWYNGAIKLQQRIGLDKRWVACFYSGEQALTGYDMLSAELDRRELKWPENPTSWTEELGQVLGQLAGKL